MWVKEKDAWRGASLLEMIGEMTRHATEITGKNYSSLLLGPEQQVGIECFARQAGRIAYSDNVQRTDTLGVVLTDNPPQAATTQMLVQHEA